MDALLAVFGIEVKGNAGIGPPRFDSPDQFLVIAIPSGGETLWNIPAIHFREKLRFLI